MDSDITGIIKNDELQENTIDRDDPDTRRGSHEQDDEQDEITRFNQNFPDDKYNFTYLVFYLLGMTTMLPWNFFVTAEDYWFYKFRNITNPNATELTPMQKSFTSDLSVSASIPGTIFLIINAIIGHLITLRMKMIGSMIAILILFIITVSFVEVNTDSWQVGFFILTMGIVVVLNSFSAILSGALFGIAGLFSSEYMTAVVSGQALGGIFSALAMIISLTFGMDAKITAIVYFNIGNIVLLISIISYIFCSHTKFFRYFVIEEGQRQNNSNKSESLETLTENEIINSQSQSTLSSIQQQNPEFMIVLRKIYLYAFAEFSVFAITLSVYPAVTVLVQSQYHGNGHPWNDIYFVPVVNYLTFNSGDYLGRIIAGIFERPRNKPVLVVCLTLIRIIFIPILLMANLNEGHNRFPIILHSDIAFISVISIFAITNGYLANIALIMAPKVVMQHEKELASSIMAACLGLGLTMGSGISLLLVALV